MTFLKQIEMEQLGNDGLGRFLCRGVVEGLSPWVPEIVDLYNEFHIDYNEYWVTASAKVSGFWIHYTARVNAFDINRPWNPLWEGDWVVPIHDEFVKGFRNRPTCPIRKNIILGEN